MRVIRLGKDEVLSKAGPDGKDHCLIVALQYSSGGRADAPTEVWLSPLFSFVYPNL